MKKRIRKLITGIMTASILSQSLSGTVSMAAGIDGDSGSSDSAVVLEESVEGDEGEATDAESEGDNANASSSGDDLATDRATGASDNSEDSANDDANVSLGQNDEEESVVDTVSSDDGSVSSNDNFMTVSFGDAGVVDVLDSEDESDNAKEESENNDDEISERGILESELSGEPYIFDYDSFRVEWNIVSHWEGACNVSVSLTNKSDETIHNWNLSFLSEDEIINPYNARITSEGCNGNKWTFKNAEYNQDIRSGESIQFGFQVKYGERIDIPFSYSIDSSEKKVSDADYEISDQIISSWDGGAVGELHIVNNKDTAIEDWTVTVRTDAVFLTVWGGSIKKVSENTYEFSCPDYFQNIAPGQTAVIGYQISGDNTEINVLELREKASEGVLNDTVSDNSLAETFITLDTDGYGENAAGPIVTEKIDHISGTVQYPDSISLITYKVMDVMDKCVKEGELDIDGSDWKAEGIGLSVGINHIVFTILFNDKSEKEEIIDITNLSIENMYAADIDLSDSDDDGMPNYFEEYFGTDLQKDDTDGDGLKDTEEMYLTGSDPLVYDSLKSGVPDGDYDTDEDGLSNRTEVGLGTDPLYADTDYDELNDGYEYNTTGTDPLKYDTDEDGFSDKEEMDLGLDPFNADSDGNGIADGDELVAQTVSNDYPEGPVDKVTVNIACKGSVIENMYISDKFDGNSIVTDVEGIIGEPVIIECFSDFDTADITFTYDETMLGDTNEEDLCMMWYDEANNDFILLEDSVVDTVNNTVTYHTTHFSTYLILDKAKFKKAFEKSKVGYKPGSPEFTLDPNHSSSINGKIKYDKDYYILCFDMTVSAEDKEKQVAVARAIIEQMSEEDSITIIQYYTGSYEQSYYTDKASVTEEIDKIYERREEIKESYNGIFPVMICHATNHWNSSKDSNKKLFIFYPGNMYDDSIKEYLDKPIPVWSPYGIYEGIKKAVDNDVIINTVAISNSTSEDMDSLIPITGGMSYSDQDGIDALIEQILNDLAAQKEAVKNIAAGDSDGDGLPDSEEIGGMLAVNGHTYHTDPYKKDSDGDDYTDGEEMVRIVETQSEYDLADFDGDGETTPEEMSLWRDVLCKTDADNNGINDAEDMIKASEYVYYKPISDPKNKFSYAGMFGDGFLEVSEDYDMTPYNIYYKINCEEPKKAPWHEYPRNRKGEVVIGLGNLHYSLDPVNDYIEGNPLNGKDDSLEVENSFSRMSYLDEKYLIWIAKYEAYKLSANGSELFSPLEAERNKFPGELLNHYLSNDGSTVKYDANMVMGLGIFDQSARVEKIKLVNRLKKQCARNMRPGEFCYIALSPNENYAGTDIYYVDKVEPLAAASIAMNPRTFIAVNQTDATIYAKCSCNQLGVIDISYDYYIWDYYDWGPGQEDLYSLNTFGYACNFLNVGQLHGDTFTFCNNK